ncbi:hypothetical protein HYQ46_001677 [Verticillium longisporum]|nr:hypothetical protein HYQ46_001677 [Verticillium longisporum]
MSRKSTCSYSEFDLSCTTRQRPRRKEEPGERDRGALEAIKESINTKSSAAPYPSQRRLRSRPSPMHAASDEEHGVEQKREKGAADVSAARSSNTQ